MEWRRLKRSAVVDTRWLRVFRDVYQLPDGDQVDDYYIVERSDFVVVVAGDLDSVVLVRQYRPATNRFYWSLPAGYIGLGEAPEEAARRELLEETGRHALDAVLLAELDPLPGYIKSRAFVIRCHVSSDASQIADPSEIIESRVFSWAEALAMITDGSLNEMQAVSGLLLARHFDSRRDPAFDAAHGAEPGSRVRGNRSTA